MLLAVLAAGCLAVPSSKADTLGFVEKSLGLRLSAEVFGTPLSEFAETKEADPSGPRLDSDASFTWYTASESAAYESIHAGRFLRFGFKGGELAAIRIFINPYFASETDPERKVLPEIVQDLCNLSKEPLRMREAAHLSFKDKHLLVRYYPYCTLAENAFAVVLLTPPTTQEKSAEPGGSGNRNQPAGVKTNRTSATSGSGP